MENEVRQVNDIVWREDLYPRFEPNPTAIQRYADDIELLPPIEVNQNNELIDGYHRWTAHKKANVETIHVIVTTTNSDRHFAKLAMRRNKRHGVSISNDEKKSWLLKWYTGLDEAEKAELAEDLGVSLRSVKRWTSRKDKDLKHERNRKIADMWLACYTEQEIAEVVGLTKQAVSVITTECQKDDTWHKFDILSRYQEPDWSPPLYNVWKQQTKSNTTSHFGNSEASFVDRLLYLYTNPFDIVVDPFSGGGSTIDVCKNRLRRYWASDRLPIVERRDIRQWDILEGPPPLHKRWQDVSLLYLDPPYWKQAEGQYSTDGEDLANMSLADFYTCLCSFIGDCASKMRSGSHIALLMQPTQWKNEDKIIEDHIQKIVEFIGSGLRLEIRISCPYESQQCTAQQVEWAKINKQLLVLTRELVVWEVL